MSHRESQYDLRPLGEIARIFTGYGFPKAYQGVTTGKYPFFKVGDISHYAANGQYRLGRANNYINEDVRTELKIKHLIPSGAVVFAKIGEALKLNRRCMTSEPSVVDNNVVGIKGRDFIVDKYLYYFLLSFDIADLSRATTVPSVRKSDLESILVPVPKFEAQNAIVAKIDTLFSELDEAEAELKVAKEKLELYRQSLLKAAFEGKLTEQWRKENNPPSAEELLEQIKAEREEYYARQMDEWHQQVDEWEANGKEGKKPRRPKQPKEMTPLTKDDLFILPQIPKGWVWCRLGTYADTQVGYAFKSAEFVDSGIRLLRGDNIEPGKLRWENTRYWKEEEVDPNKHTLISEGSTILAMDRPLISSGIKVAEVQHRDVPALLVQRVAQVNAGNNKLILYLLNTQRFIRHCIGNQTGTQLPHISQSQIESFPIPLPPEEEQIALIDTLQERLNSTDSLLTNIMSCQQQMDVQRKSILRSAFNGKLV